LLEWRSAAACARGRCRPDGYGCYQRGQAPVRVLPGIRSGDGAAREYAAKIEAYYWYRDTGRAARDYVGFPTILFVTALARAEADVAHQAYLAAERHGGNPLPIVLTTSRHLEAAADHALGAVWRAPGPFGSMPARGYWLPGSAQVKASTVNCTTLIGP
jgi:hypothetical protein